MTSQQEDQLVKWLIVEITNYINEAHPHFIDRLFLTHVHKVLFKIAEMYRIPITRSWYMYGGFIHSDLLMKEEFLRIKGEIFFHERIEELRSEIYEAVPSVENILSSLRNEVDNFVKMDLKEYIKRFYEEAPKRYRPIYLTKYDIFYTLSSLSQRLSNYYSVDFDDIYQLFSNFHKSAFRLFYDDDVEEISINYFELFENTLNKVELLSKLGRPLYPVHFEILNSLSSLFDNYCWKPYACLISYETVQGPRVERENNRILYRKKVSIDEAKDNLNIIIKSLSQSNLMLTLEDITQIKSSDEEIIANKAFDRLFKIYNKYKR